MSLTNTGPAEAGATRPWPADRWESWPIEQLGCGHIAASTSVAFPGNGSGADIDPYERGGRRATRQQQHGSAR